MTLLANLIGPDIGIVVFVLLGLGLWLWPLVDAAVRPSLAFETAGKGPKALWLAFIVFLGWIGGFIYLLAIRPSVLAAQNGIPPQAAATPGGWHPDPYGRHSMRYWNGAAWTAFVSDGGQSFEDPL